MRGTWNWPDPATGTARGGGISCSECSVIKDDYDDDDDDDDEILPQPLGRREAGDILLKMFFHKFHVQSMARIFKWDVM